MLKKTNFENFYTFIRILSFDRFLKFFIYSKLYLKIFKLDDTIEQNSPLFIVVKKIHGKIHVYFSHIYRIDITRQSSTSARRFHKDRPSAGAVVSLHLLAEFPQLCIPSPGWKESWRGLHGKIGSFKSCRWRRHWFTGNCSGPEFVHVNLHRGCYGFLRK